MSAQPTKLTSLSVFLPCLNEAKNIPTLIGKLNTVLPTISKKYEIIIVDDGSSDNSQAVATKLTEKFSYVRLIKHPSNLGYGAAIQTGINEAQYEWIFFTDGDGQFNTQELVEFIPHTQKYNAIIGYRTHRAEGTMRAINARLFKLFIDLIFRVGVKDIDCAFKLIRAKNLKSLHLISSGAMISAEILYRLKKKKVTFKQLPVTHYPRIHGSPTGNNLSVIIKAGSEALKLYLNIKTNNLK